MSLPSRSPLAKRSTVRFAAALIVTVYALPAGPASAQDLRQPSTGGTLLQAGRTIVEQTVHEEQAVAAFAARQLQPTRLKSDRKTTIILVSIVAAAVVVYMLYQFEHSGPILSP